MKVTIRVTKRELERLVFNAVTGELETELVGELDGTCVKVNQEIPKPPRPPKPPRKKPPSKKPRAAQ
jgi:hypothetical protein